MAYVPPDYCYLTDLAHELEVNYSVIYYLRKSGLITATKMTVPEFLDLEILWSMGRFWFTDATGKARSTRPVRLMVRLEEVKWIFILEEEFPQIFEQRPRGWLRFEKAEYERLMKGDDSNEQYNYKSGQTCS